jgi:aryl-alcohol dehydrogenase-like predicted oxidoreductase
VPDPDPSLKSVAQSCDRSLSESEYSLWWRAPAAELLQIDENTTFDSSDFRNTVPGFEPEARRANRAFVELLAGVAERKNATPAQIALAWLLAQKPWVAPIPATTKLARVDENIRAADVELTSDDLREIDSAASEITAHGARYPEHLERMTGR